ncbi:MAG: hypothetical protein HYS23_11875 [Geobacter sp.]|nr:hypothetical protein [Geobacter sp.]
MKESLVHQKTVEIAGESYLISVYSRTDGRHFARTYFSDFDVIINDGLSLLDALAKQEELLPLAVNSRRLMRELNRKS